MKKSESTLYMYIEALSDNTQISFSNESYQYRVGENGEWLKIAEYPVPLAQAGEKVYFKGVLYSSVSGVGNFTVDKEYKVGGDLRSLIYGDDTKKASPLMEWCFIRLFADSPIKEISMDSLPTTTLASGCYAHMFEGCTSLTTAPELPATTLASDCYAHMFEGCTSLTTAPELPATTLASGCYAHMFEGCSNLNYIKMLATDISASYCLYYWVSGVASSGTFVKNSAMTSLPTATSSNNYEGIPSGWTVQNA